MIEQHAPSAEAAARAAHVRGAPTSTAQEEVIARRRRVQEQVLTVGSPILLLVLWEVLVRAQLLDRRFFPAPSSIVDTFGALIASGQLLLDVRDTLTRVFVGLLLGGADFQNMYWNISGKSYPNLKAARDAGAAVIAYGNFINTVITFVIVALVAFLIGRALIKATVSTKVCPRCGMDVPIPATRCPFCTSDLAAVGARTV